MQFGKNWYTDEERAKRTKAERKERDWLRKKWEEEGGQVVFSFVNAMPPEEQAKWTEEVTSNPSTTQKAKEAYAALPSGIRRKLRNLPAFLTEQPRPDLAHSDGWCQRAGVCRWE